MLKKCNWLHLRPILLVASPQLWKWKVNFLEWREGAHRTNTSGCWPSCVCRRPILLSLCPAAVEVVGERVPSLSYTRFCEVPLETMLGFFQQRSGADSPVVIWLRSRLELGSGWLEGLDEGYCPSYDTVPSTIRPFVYI